MKQQFGIVLTQEDVVLAFKWWAVGLCICGLLLGLDWLGAMAAARGAIEQQLWPVTTRMIALRQTASRPFVVVGSVFSRHERIAALEERLAAAAVDQRRLRELEAQATFGRQHDYRASTLTELFVRDDVAMVGVGEVQGLLPGMAVTDAQGILVGRIESVGRYVSRVELVGSLPWSIPAQTADGMALGVVYADGGEVVFGEVLQTEPLAVGDIVVTGGGQGSALPFGLVIGQVVNITGSEADVTKKGVLSLLSQRHGWAAVW